MERVVISARSLIMEAPPIDLFIGELEDIIIVRGVPIGTGATG